VPPFQNPAQTQLARDHLRIESPRHINSSKSIDGEVRVVAHNAKKRCHRVDSVEIVIDD